MSPGRSVRRIPVPEWPRAELTVFDFVGERAGPRVTVFAGMGGTAYPGIEACWRLAQRLDDSEISGSVHVIPTLDAAGFLDRSMHFSPLDDRPIAAAFDGWEGTGPPTDGSAGAAIAGAVRDELASSAFHIDVRGGEVSELHAHWVAALPSDADSGAMAQRAATASGADYQLVLRDSVEPTVSLGTAGLAARLGVPAVILSTGGVNYELDRDAENLLADILRVLTAVGVLAGVPTSRDAPRTLGPRSWTHHARGRGSWVPRVTAGQQVLAGQRLGQVRDYFGDVLEDIHTPMHGRVLALTTGMAVDPAPRADGDQWLARTLTIAEDPGTPWAT